MCHRQIYLVDRFVFNDRAMHRACFKCNTCQQTLSIQNSIDLDGQIYCRAHAQQLKMQHGGHNSPSPEALSLSPSGASTTFKSISPVAMDTRATDAVKPSSTIHKDEAQQTVNAVEKLDIATEPMSALPQDNHAEELATLRSQHENDHATIASLRSQLQAMETKGKQQEQQYERLVQEHNVAKSQAASRAPAEEEYEESEAESAAHSRAGSPEPSGDGLQRKASGKAKHRRSQRNKANHKHVQELEQRIHELELALKASEARVHRLQQHHPRG